MKRRLLAALLCAVLVAPSGSVTASAEILDYEGTLNSYKQDNKTPQIFEIDNGSGKSVSVMAKSDTVTVSAKSTMIFMRELKDWLRRLSAESVKSIRALPRIRKSPLKFYAQYYSILSGDFQALIITELWRHIYCFICYFSISSANLNLCT